MKKSELRSLIREMIEEELSTLDEKQSEAAKKAKQMGLKNLGFGRWGKDGETEYITDKSGNLVKYTKGAVEKKTGMKFSRSKHDAPGTLMSPSGVPAAKMTEPGKVQRALPRRSPAQQRRMNEPRDILGDPGRSSGDVSATTDHPTAQRLIDKIHDKVYVTGDDGKQPAEKYGYHVDVPMDQVEKDMGITRDAAKWYSKNVDGYEKAFEYDADTDTISFNDPYDV